jgi:hypothetical protein
MVGRWFRRLGFGAALVAGLAAVAVSASAQVVPGAASAVGGNVAFAPNLVGTVTRTAIPTSPPQESWRLSAVGTAAPLGAFRYQSTLRVHFGVDGQPLSITDGVGTFTGIGPDNRGDAIVFTLSGIFRPGGGGAFDAVFIVTGGSGRFAGLVGSGRIAASADLAANTFVGAWDGTLKNSGI